MTFGMQLFGEVQLIRKMDQLKTRVQKKLARQSVLAAARVVAKAIKKEIPSAWKEGRKSIGSSAKDDKTTGVVMGKAGVGVGMKKGKRAKINAKLKPRGKRKGVGLGVNNFHWFLMGTDDRHTGTKKGTKTINGVKTVTQKATGNAKKFTGRMKKTPIVQRAWASSKGAAKKTMIANLRAGIEREAAKR